MNIFELTWYGWRLEGHVARDKEVEKDTQCPQVNCRTDIMIILEQAIKELE